MKARRKNRKAKRKVSPKLAALRAVKRDMKMLAQHKLKVKGLDPDYRMDWILRRAELAGMSKAGRKRLIDGYFTESARHRTYPDKFDTVRL